MLGFELLSPPAALMLANIMTCKGAENVDIDVILRKDPIVYDKTKTAPELTAMFSDIPKSDQSAIIGVHKPINDLRYDYRFKWLKTGEYVCFHLTEITISLHHSTTIYLAKDRLERPCQSNTTLKHEIQHHRINLQTARKFKHQFYREARKFAKENVRYGPFPYNDYDAKNQALFDALKRHLAPTVKAWTAETIRRQAKIDTEEEYARLSQKCRHRDAMAQ